MAEPYQRDPHLSFRENFKKDMLSRELGFVESDFVSTMKAGWFNQTFIEHAYFGWLIGHNFFGRDMEDIYP